MSIKIYCDILIVSIFKSKMQELKQEFQNNRALLDFYPTPPEITQALVDTIELPEYFIECCDGNGGMSKVLRQHFEMGVTTDIQKPYNVVPVDATKEEYWDFWMDYFPENSQVATITNPPFNQAEKILPLAFKYSSWGVAFLLRLSYQEATNGRAQWLKEHSDNLIMQMTVNPRIKFRKDKKSGDSITCAWFVWKKDFSWTKLGLSCPFQYLTDWR